MSNPRPAVAILAGAVSLASPVAAGQIFLRYGQEVVDPFALRLTETGEAVADGSVVVAIDPSRLVADLAQIGPGRTRQDLNATGTLTNLLDAPVSGVFDIDGGFILDGTFDAPNERAAAFASVDVLLGDQRIGGVSIGGGPFDYTWVEECDEIPCRYVYGFPDGRGEEFTIGAGETLPIEFSVAAEVAVLAPIPLPAALGPAALAIGGLAWAGRRKPRL